MPVDLTAGLLVSGLAMGLVFGAHLLLGLAEVDVRGRPELGVRLTFVAVGEERIFGVLLFTGLRRLVAHSDTALLLETSPLFDSACWSKTEASPISIVSIAHGGLMYGRASLKTDRVGLPIAVHFGWNCFQGADFGFLVSGKVVPGLLALWVRDTVLTGGPFGPEEGLRWIAARLILVGLALACERFTP